jgi:hypothetical protein
LYARKAASAARWGADKSAPDAGAGGQPGGTALERSAKIGFKAGIGGIEQFSTGYYDDVDGRFGRQPSGLPEDLSYQPFSAIPLDRIPQLSGGHDTQPRDPAVVGGDEDGQIPALGPERQIENAGEFVAAPNPAGFREALGAHTRLAGSWAVRYEEETVRRLRPLARRRFRTSRPFLVAMRTRNPCVRLRRRRLGWKVTLIIGSLWGERLTAEKLR